jgi:carbon monoxide dehydrogenase subunit G
MKLEQSFDVQAPVEEVWAALIDVERVAPCLPGAEITEASADGSYAGVFTIKVGPATAVYNGTLKMDQLDEASRVATMHASGTDKRGQGGAKASIVSRLREDGGVTHVDVETDLTITGRLAQFGRPGIIQDVSNRLMGQFASCLQASLAPREAQAEAEAGTAAVVASASASAPPAEPIKGFRLLLGVLWDRIKRLFGGGRKKG